MNEPIRTSHLHTLDFEGHNQSGIFKEYEISMNRDYLSKCITQTTQKTVLQVDPKEKYDKAREAYLSKHG